MRRTSRLCQSFYIAVARASYSCRPYFVVADLAGGEFVAPIGLSTLVSNAKTRNVVTLWFAENPRQV